MLVDDPNRLVRVRAAEFLGLIQEKDPMAALAVLLSQSVSPIEANEILNSIVLLRDGSPGYHVELTVGDLHSSVRDDKNVKRRLEYLTSSQARSGRNSR